MTVKHKIRFIAALLVIAAAALVASVAAGCKIGMKSAQERLDSAGMHSCVTYYSNGGMFRGSLTKKDMYYKAGSPIVNIGVDTFDEEITRRDYVFTGWEYVELDADGNPVYADEQNGIVKTTGEAVFPGGRRLYIEDNAHLIVAATWVQDRKLEIRLGGTESITAVKEVQKVENGVPVVDANNRPVTETVEYTVNPGDLLSGITYSASGKVKLDDKTPLESTTHTFIDFYAEQSLETLLPAGTEFTKPEDDENECVYAKYIPGQWNIIKTAEQVRSMFGNGFNKSGGKYKNYYIYQDIDCTRVTANLFTGEYGGKIAGNGHTLSGLNFVQQMQNGNSAAIFGKIAAEAEITGLTLKDINITVTVRSGASVSLYMFAAAVADGATLQVDIDGAEMKVTAPQNSTVTNISEERRNNWLCGYAGTDEAFFTAYPDVTIENEHLDY